MINFEEAKDQSKAPEGEVIFNFECDDDEWDMITKAAKIKGKTPEEYIRNAIIEFVETAKEEKEKKKEKGGKN